MRKLLFLALFFLAVLIACVSWSRPAIANEEDRVIRIASPGNHAPFTMYDEATQEWSGFEINLWRAIGMVIFMPLTIVPVRSSITILSSAL